MFLNVIVMAIVFIIISTVVGMVAKMLNGLAEANAARRVEEERNARAERMERATARARAAEDERAERPTRQAASGPEYTGGTVRTATSDMDRFLAEIDRLRRKAAANPNTPAQPTPTATVAPVVQPTKSVDRPRPRVIAELAEPATPTAGAPSFGTSPQAPVRSAPVAGQVEELPVATVLRPTSSTGAPATRVTRMASRPRPAAKTNLGHNLTALLGSGQGVAIAVVLQEILGPPKAKKNSGAS